MEACRRVGEELARCLQGACVERTRGGGASAWDRVFSPPDFCTQALTLLEYLLRNGSERSVEDARDHMYQLRTMCDFQYVEAGGVDQGINGAHAASRAIAAPATASEPATAEARTCEADASAARRAVREKSRQISDLLNDRDRLKEEREKARQNRGKYGGVSAGKMQGFGSEGGFGNSGKKYGGSRPRTRAGATVGEAAAAPAPSAGAATAGTRAVASVDSTGRTRAGRPRQQLQTTARSRCRCRRAAVARSPGSRGSK